MANLIARVHVTDDEGTPHVFTPGDDVPQWAVIQITNPKAWDSIPSVSRLTESTPSTGHEQVDLRTPKPVKRAAPRRKAATGDGAVHGG